MNVKWLDFGMFSVSTCTLLVKESAVIYMLYARWHYYSFIVYHVPDKEVSSLDSKDDTTAAQADKSDAVKSFSSGPQGEK